MKPFCDAYCTDTCAVLCSDWAVEELCMCG